mmetsp:Transcript_10157/g.23494  ORF Transcript_10157/g.23494 Transcript_10157/m.23494 type:complete len:241 (+) Transcript_10157:504-1226(+)
MRAHGVHVVAELRADGRDAALRCARAVDEVTHRLVVRLRLAGRDEVDLVLHAHHALQAEALRGGQMLKGLRRRARLVRSHEQQRGIHHRCAREHVDHERLVPRAVDQGHVPHELVLAPVVSKARVWVAAWPRQEAEVWRALVHALVDLTIGVPQADGGVALQLLLVLLRPHARESSHQARLAVSHVANDANVERRLLLVGQWHSIGQRSRRFGCLLLRFGHRRPHCALSRHDSHRTNSTR